MAESNSTTEAPRFKIEVRLDKIEALGATLGNLEWGSGLEGKYLDEIGNMIKDLAIEAKEILSEMDSQAAPEGGE